MLQKTIPAYPFQQYRDDDNIRSFFDMFNAASQDYLDWFNAVGLPYYPGLSGALLQWVGEGLYGVPYYNALESPGLPALGPLNTSPLNSEPLNFYSFPTATFYQVTDDIYKRIITWNFYKGDGKRFCPRWLKRRIMRFLVGVNGIDPQPQNPGFVVGCENTNSISVQFSGSTCEITINQLALSATLQLTPNILSIFAAAFLAPGVLEKPIEWSYTVTIETSAHALVSPLSLSVMGATAVESTGAATVSVLGGSGSYTYAWTWLSGGSGITIGSPLGAITNFSASALTPGETLTGVAQCAVTDTVAMTTITCALPVTINRVSAPTAVAVPPSIVTAGATDNITSGQVQAVASGGGAPYSYVWTWQSGGAGIGINSVNTSGTTFTGVGIADGASEAGVALCTITDAYGQVTTCTASVTLSRAAAVLASIAPASLTVTAGSSSEVTGTTTVTASGGVAPYSYSWAMQSATGAIAVNSPSAATTAFTGSSIAPNTTITGVAQCTVTDSVGQKVSVTCALTFNRESTMSASVTPGSQDSSGPAPSQTTGVSTVSASGGSGSYTYSWVWASGGVGISINQPSSAATSFTAPSMALASTYSGIAQCTVTDSFGQTTQVTVAVTLARPSETLAFSIAAGEQFGTLPNYGVIGYEVGPPIAGSITDGTVPPGQLIAAIVDEYYNNGSRLFYQRTILTITGFSSDPGINWLTQIVANSVTLPPDPTPGGYVYTGASGAAAWIWYAPFNFISGATYPVTLTYSV